MYSVLKMIILLYEDKFVDTKEAIRIHRRRIYNIIVNQNPSEKDIQYNRESESIGEGYTI